MKKIIYWINAHKGWAVLITLGIFFLPLFVVHILFKCQAIQPWLSAEWSAGDLLAYIAGFEAFVGTVALSSLALWQNEKIHNQHMESLEPALSMKLISVSGMLYLMIENTGATEAIDIKVSVLDIANNGIHDELSTDGLFDTVFDLYPKEIVQGRVAISGANIATEIFPQIKVHVSYLRPDMKRKKDYDRTVTYNCGYDIKVTADINYDNTRMESDIDAIARASVRTANYFDGHQVAKFDELNILAGKSLRNDLVEVIQKQEICPVINRTDTIAESIIPKSSEEDNANT